jgi:hypothetical protein
MAMSSWNFLALPYNYYYDSQSESIYVRVPCSFDISDEPPLYYESRRNLAADAITRFILLDFALPAAVLLTTFL